MRNLLLFVLSCALLSFAAAIGFNCFNAGDPTSTVYVSNCDFSGDSTDSTGLSQATPSSWTSSNGQVFVVDPTQTTAFNDFAANANSGASGGNFVALNVTASSLSQDISYTIGYVFQLTFWAASGVNPTYASELTVMWDDLAILGPIMLTNSWTQYTVRFTANNFTALTSGKYVGQYQTGTSVSTLKFVNSKHYANKVSTVLLDDIVLGQYSFTSE